MIEDEATVKTFYKENGHFRLQPENDTYEPIIVNEVSILGKVVAVIRYYLICAQPVQAFYVRTGLCFFGVYYV